MAGSALKILHVFDHSVPLHSGYSFRSLALLAAQRRRGWQTVHVTTPRHEAPGPDYEEVDGFGFHRTPRRHDRPAGLPAIGELADIRATAERIRRVASREKPDLLHAHSPVLTALAALWAGRRLRLPVVYEVRAFWEDAAVGNGDGSEGNLRYRAIRALDSFAFRRVDAITAICEGLRSDIAARGIPVDKIALIPNGVDLEQFPLRGEGAHAMRQSLGLTGKIVLGFFGSFYPYEGLDLLIDAIVPLKRAGLPVVAMLVGGGPAETDLKAQADRLGLADAVRFIGRVPHQRIGDYYDAVDLLVFPRRAMRLTETVTPLKPLEAMARGAIVLASDVGGHRELVRHGETGFLFPGGDAAALAAAVRSALAQQAEWPALRRQGRDFVERERSWDRSAEGYVAAYTSALDRHASRALPVAATGEPA